MEWNKQGAIFEVNKHADWMQSHSAFPTVFLMDDCIRIFFSTRCENMQSRIGYIDVEKDNPKNILNIAKDPVLPLGKLGTFDDCGTTPNCVVRNDDKVFLYYFGWNKMVTIPCRTTAGLAISHDGGHTFEKFSDGPIIDRNFDDPYFTTNPWVIKEGDTWHMWYVSVTGWVIINDKPEGKHMLKYAHSKDGIHWQRDNQPCIKPHFELECIANPCVVKDHDTYKMWYCYRQAKDFRNGENSYRIGYAESKDKIHWQRDDDNVGITYSKEGWDSLMQAYPTVLDVDDKRYLFYNGNGFGFAGIGYAIAE